MKVIVLGAGNVGRAVVDALHTEHDLTVIDVDGERLALLGDRYDIRTVTGNGTTKRVMREAGIEDSALLIACSPREDANLVSAMLAKKLSRARVIVRTSSVEYLEAWREREIDVDFMVSSELETANAISGLIGIPAARQTDVFAEGKVQIVEFDVPGDEIARDRSEEAPPGPLIGRPLREAEIPADSKVAAIIRDNKLLRPSGGQTIEAGDRIVVIAAPNSARDWSRLIARTDQEVDDIVIFGAGRMGSTIARVLLERDIRVRLVDSDAERAQQAAEDLPEARVFNAQAFDPEFLVRQRIGRSTAAVFCMNDDAKNLYAAVLARVQGVHLTVTLVHDPTSVPVYERAGIDVAINPRQVIAEELVRFAHDPRLRQIAMLDDDRFEILDITVREDSDLARKKFDDLPQTGSMIGAVIRNGRVLFPHGSDTLEPGDRVIVFVESRRASLVEKAL
jgi:trk system potassium uptake protein